MKTIAGNKRLQPQLISPNLPGTQFQSAGQALFFDEASMNSIRVFAPVDTPDNTKFYPYYFNVQVNGDVDATKFRSLTFDIQIKDPNDSTALTKLVGSVTPAYVIDGANSSDSKAQVNLFQDDDTNPDVLGIVVGQQNSLTNYGVVIYIRGGKEVSGFSTANIVTASGAEVSEATFGGVAYPVGVTSLPAATFNRKNVVKFVTSGQYNTLNKLFEVDQNGNAKELETGGGSGSGITPPINSSEDTLGLVGQFHQLDLRAGGLVFTLPNATDHGVVYGDIVRVGDRYDSATLMTPLIIDSAEPIHSETDENEKKVYIFEPARMVWQYQGSTEGWICVDGIGEGGENLPYEEVELLAYKEDGYDGAQTIMGDFNWSDFDRVEFYQGNVGQSEPRTHYGPIVISSVEITRNPTKWTSVGGATTSTAVYSILNATGNKTVNISNNNASYKITHARGYVKYRPVLERPKRTEVLYESDVGKQRGETITLSESMVKYDQLLITAKLEYGGLSYIQTATYTPKDILTSGRTLDVGRWIASSNNTDYCLVQIITGSSSETTLSLGGGDKTYSPGKIIKVEGFNFLAQNVLAGGSGAGISPPMLKTTDFDIGINEAYAVDMADSVSKTATKKEAMLNDQWFTISSIRAKNVDGCFITIDTPLETWGYGDGTSRSFRFPARSNATYTIQKIDGQLFIINEAGVGNEFVDAPAELGPCYRENGEWVPAFKVSVPNPLEDVVNTNYGVKEPNLTLINQLISGGGKFIGGVYAPDGLVYAIPWMSATYLTIDPIYGNINSFGSASGNGNYLGASVTPEGDIYFAPYHADNILVLNCFTRETRTFPTGLTGANKFYGSLLVGDKLILTAFDSPDHLVVDIKDDSIIRVPKPTSSDQFIASVLAPDGKVYLFALGGKVNILNLEDNSIEELASFPEPYYGLALGPDGNIYGAPNTVGDRCIKFDPTSRTWEYFGDTVATQGYYDLTLAADGKMYAAPYAASQAMQIDPETKTAKTFGYLDAAAAKYMGSVLSESGRIICIPHSNPYVGSINTNHPCPDNFWGLSPYVNNY